MKNKFTKEEVDGIILQEIKNILSEQEGTTRRPPGMEAPTTGSEEGDTGDTGDTGEEAPAPAPEPEPASEAPAPADPPQTSDPSQRDLDAVAANLKADNFIGGNDELGSYFEVVGNDDFRDYKIYQNGAVADPTGEFVSERSPRPGEESLPPYASIESMKTPEKPKYAKSWAEYAGKGEQEAEIARLWAKLTAKETMQEALEGYTNSFSSYAKFYKDEVAKQGKKFISPEDMVALLKSKLQEPDKMQAQLKFARDRQAQAEAAYNKVREEFSVIKAKDKEIADKQVALGVPGKLKFKKRKEYNDLNKQRLETLAQLKAKKKEVDQAFEVLRAARTKVVDKSAESASEKTKVNEPLISESTFDRWQTLIKS